MTSDREFVHARVIDAPPDEVFRAFSDPRCLAAWWGPKGFSSTFDVFDLRAGGAWRFVMHGPDGRQYPNECVFREVVANERVVIEHLGGVHHFVLTITLEPLAAGKTLLRWHQLFDTAEHRNRIAPIVIQANEENLDRLAAVMPRRGSMPKP
jgi:uncharacterized protein YndB with AHSA1/START domain